MTPEPPDPALATGTGSVTPERFARVRAIFEAALEQPVRDRPGFVKGACVGDVALLREVEAMLAADATGVPLLDRPASTPSSSAPEEGRFPAGTVLAGRYRILGRLGQGGMGEVYRAHDLILNQTVALKFLAPAHVSEAALVRFRNEVRIARQVSHPHVCRVYDLGMVDGLHFLSMEYIDGEDLASLLRRIGRLPQDKAIEFTRKICAGLGAAHERGVLHRDLKPANVMIDGRGQPRITDFGLAGLAAEIPLSDLRSGTPAYMSPEQKAGKDVTTRSDLYSLGLVLHEMFTGKARKDTQSHPSDLVKDLDPAIERLILRCLEEDPKRRPASAFNVAMALPGADPIAAALAAGETPSPEMVAASQEKEGISPRAATVCFAAVVAVVIASAFFSTDSRLLRLAPLDIPPERLAFTAEDILKRIGYAAPHKASAYGFVCCDLTNLSYAEAQQTSLRDEILRGHQPPVIRFWYRQHQDVIYPPPQMSGGTGPPGAIAYDAPPNTEPGMARVVLDPRARLLALDVRPGSNDSSLEPASDVDWNTLLALTGFSPLQLTATAPTREPPMPFDARAAWIGTYPSQPSRPLRIEAAARHGRPVFLSVDGNDDLATASSSNLDSADTAVFLFLLVLVCVGAPAVALHNLRSGKGDRKGAARIAIVFASSLGAALLLLMSHVPRPWEALLLWSGAGDVAVRTGLLWCAYVAVEPYARRHWPESLISWNRLQAGRIRDPLVMSHVLAGLTAWTVARALSVPLWQWVPIRVPEWIDVLNSPATYAGFLAQVPAGMLTFSVGFLLMVVVLRLVARRRLWIADIAACVLFGLTGPIDRTSLYAFVMTAVPVFIVVSMLLWLVRRFGFVALMSAALARVLLSPFVLGTWYTGRGLITQAIIVGVAGWAFWVIVTQSRSQRESLI